MLKYFSVRLISLIPKLIIITIIIFLGLQLVPGDPVSRTIPPDQYAKMSEKQLDDLREELGLNDSLVEQYFRWFFGVIKGDFGYSLSSGASIRSMIATRLPATFELAIFGLLIATVFGLILGFISAIKRNTFIDYFNTTLGMIGLSVPEFFFGLCGILLFAIALKWLPTGGRFGYGEEAFVDRFKYLIMPAASLGISLIATLMRFTRGSMLDVLSKDYIKTARSKGLSEVKVNIKHGFRNALIPIMVIIVLRLPMLVGGTVVIETVFNYPGMGSMLLEAVSATDMPLVMITTMIIATFILVASFLVDIVVAMLDPRIKFGS